MSLLRRMLFAFLGLWGRDANGELLAWASFINRNVDQNWKPKGPPWEGDVSLHFPRGRQIRIAWNLFGFRGWHCHAILGADPMDLGACLSFALPPLGAVWLSAEGIVPLGFFKRWGSKHMELSLRVHDSAVWWRLWSPADEWSSTTPRWRDGNWRPADTFLGREKCTWTEVERREVFIPMPEGAYPATAVLEEGCWKRPRWRAKRRMSCKLDFTIPIPDDHKGPVYAMSRPARSIPEAVGMAVGDILSRRGSYTAEGFEPPTPLSPPAESLPGPTMVA